MAVTHVQKTSYSVDTGVMWGRGKQAWEHFGNWDARKRGEGVIKRGGNEPIVDSMCRG